MPNNTGISYSFTDDGFFEEAKYQFTANRELFTPHFRIERQSVA